MNHLKGIADIAVDIRPSPYQPRKYFDPAKIAELAANIKAYGLIHPIVVRAFPDGYRLMVGERRLRAVKELGWPTIRAELRDVDEAIERGIVLSENLKRDDLTAIETIEATALWIDHEMQNDIEYQQLVIPNFLLDSQLKQDIRKIAYLLMKLDSDYKHNTNELGHKFMSKLESAFASLPTPIDWRSFYVNDLQPFSRMPEDVKQVAITQKLNKSQAKALTELHQVAPQEVRRIQQQIERKETPKLAIRPDEYAPEEEIELGDLSARDIKAKVKEIKRASEPPSLPHVAHNSGENEWYTPKEYIQAARDVLGTIDLDPASCPEANKTVQATTYYTIETDGLHQEWTGRVWMNPPYESSLIGEFCTTLARFIKSNDVTEAIVLVNNATETTWFQTLVDISHAIVFPRGRIRFLSPHGELGAPLQGQAFLYSGNAPEKFLARFFLFGWGGMLYHGTNDRLDENLSVSR